MFEFEQVSVENYQVGESAGFNGSRDVIDRVDLPRLELADPPYVELGGTVLKEKTYGKLVTAIINPSHKLAQGYPIDIVSNGGESKMAVYRAL